jgi:LacI family transcriptional regulator
MSQMTDQMTKRKRVTISQVAREAGVSTQTVSRVINSRPDVSPATRRQVQEVIDRLGYRPSHAARTLSQGQSYSIGVVAYGIEYFGPSRALSGIEKKASELGYTPLLYLLRDPESNSVSQVLDDLISRHVDGIIWAVPEIGDNRSWLKDESFRPPVPLVLHSMGDHSEASITRVDNYRGGKLATQHLIEQGHRDIGLITGPMDWWEARERVRGWEDALTEAGIAHGESRFVYGNWSAASGERGLGQLLEQRPGMSAVFIANDQMALGALLAARKRKLQLPADLAIVGFDDVPESAYFWPPLTTISQPLYDMGCASVDELERLIKESRQGVEIQPRTTVLQPTLIVRASSAMK